MFVSVAAVLLGALIVYAGWKNLSVWSLLKGDNTTPKPIVQGGGSGTATVRNPSPVSNG